MAKYNSDWAPVIVDFILEILYIIILDRLENIRIFFECILSLGAKYMG